MDDNSTRKLTQTHPPKHDRVILSLQESLISQIKTHARLQVGLVFAKYSVDTRMNIR